jgi:acyl transferase domain-containing protein
MAGRFPGARDLEAFWRNLRDGVESIVPVTATDLASCGADPNVLGQSGYVAAAAPIDDIDMFDAAFFGYSPREAESIDPQQRLFLETSWHALEDAGIDPAQDPGTVGVFAGCSMNTYVHQLYANAKYMAAAGFLQTLIGNDKDYLSSRVSYKLDLRGPSVTVQTACSTGLVAVVQAAKALFSGECDVALAGAVTLRVPHRAGYWFQPGGIYAPDGHCRPFGADAQGTVFGSGLGIVVMKRLRDAVAERYNIRAVIRGVAINNDGGLKVGFTAPSLQGQTKVIKAAHAAAGVNPSTIGYVETHGTGTPLGDPIEIEALSSAFAGRRKRAKPCAVGSVKSNIGHLDAAAGMAGLIKTALMLENGEIVPSLHAEPPSTVIGFEDTPFRVNTTLRGWPAQQNPRRAGVSAFGIGGTNAHAVLEEGRHAAPDPRRRKFQLLTLSAATPTGLTALSERFAEHLTAHPDDDLADLAYTTQIGRRALRFRRTVTCADSADAVRVLRDHADPTRARPVAQRSTIAFMFSGQGTQHHAMAAALYRAEAEFAQTIDYCAERLSSPLGVDLRDMIAREPTSAAHAEKINSQLRCTSLAQPALFVVEYALARLLSVWGVKPNVMIGHSVGEWVAACLAGVWSIDDALALVAERGRLVGALPKGSMLAVAMDASDAASLLGPRSSVAAINEAGVTVVAGPHEEIDTLRSHLSTRGVQSQALHTSHAFHSPAMKPAVAPLIEAVSRVPKSNPRIPFVSNVTGSWVKPECATDPEYWGRHLLSTVRFAHGMNAILESASVIVEIGPGNTLARFALRHPLRSGQPVLSTLPGPQEKASPRRLVEIVGEIWCAGSSPDWSRFHASYSRRRVRAPGYPFERRRYWVEAAAGSYVGSAPEGNASSQGGTEGSVRRDIAEWFAVPNWKTTPLQGVSATNHTRTWLVLDDGTIVGKALLRYLRVSDASVVAVSAASTFARTAPDKFTVDPAEPAHLQAAVQALTAEGRPPNTVAHLWLVTDSEDSDPGIAGFEATQDRGFRSLLALAQALTASLPQSQRIDVVVAASGLHKVSGHEKLSPAKATLLGPLRSMSQEYPQLAVRCVDVDLGEASRAQLIAEAIAGEVDADDGETAVAVRAGKRLALRFKPLHLPTVTAEHTPLRNDGVYLITGGLGNVGYNLAETLARELKARLVLLARSGLPPRRTWSQVLASESAVADRVGRVRRLEDLGSSVMVRSVSLVDRQALGDILDEVESCFGPLNGIIHAAGNIDPVGFPTIDQTGPAAVSGHFAPKAHGLLTLVAAMAGRAPVDFWLLVSSLSSVLGGLGFSAYAGANAFLDAYVASRRGHLSTRWISVDWDAWDFTEPAAATAISPAAGQDAFMRIMGAPDLGQLVVSATSLQDRLDRWTNLRSLQGTVHTDSAKTLAPARPELAGDYVPPATALERELAEIWQEVLGLQLVGARDNFFTELGGHSLLATQLISKIRTRCGLDLPLPTFFEGPTLEQLATAMEALRSKTQQHPSSEPGPIRRRKPTRAVLQSDGRLQVLQ